jgi:hypothetical protein
MITRTAASRSSSDEQHLIGLANRMRLFAPLDEAEATISKRSDRAAAGAR